MTLAHAQFSAAYASALVACDGDASESALRAAYELGRQAVADGLSVLDLAAVHHEALLEALARAGTADAAAGVATSAADFFVESLSAFEMVQRGFREARDAALVERRQTAMLRQLSSFLADTSLALNAPDAAEEVLQLVAEHARELAGAGFSLASLAVEDGAAPVVAVVPAAERVAPESVLKLSTAIDAGAQRLSAAELADDPASSALAKVLGADAPLRGRLVVPLTGLDGRELGSIQLFHKAEDEFTAVDEAVLVHLAQTASAALERARLYDDARRAAAPGSVPGVAGLELVAHITDGGWYDALERPDGSVAIGVGTAAPSTAAAGHARAAFCAAAPHARAPEELVAAVDGTLRTIDPAVVPSTAAAVVDAARREARVARSGEPPDVLSLHDTAVLDIRDRPPSVTPRGDR